MKFKKSMKKYISTIFTVKETLKTGIGFGLTSGIITTLGLIIGLQASTRSKITVIAGLLTIAVSDTFSDALGIHISEESRKDMSSNQIWESTIITFVTKFTITLSFLIPILLFSASNSIIVSIIWGLSLLSIFSYYIARERKDNPLKTIGEHVFISIVVIILTHYLGSWMHQFV